MLGLVNNSVIHKVDFFVVLRIKYETNDALLVTHCTGIRSVRYQTVSVHSQMKVICQSAVLWFLFNITSLFW